MQISRRIPLPHDPVVCPECGEVVIAIGLSMSPDAMRLVQEHPDMVTPYISCAASAQVIKAGKLLRDE